VTVRVSDGRIEVPLMSWNVTVLNTDRLPTVTGVDLYIVLENGALKKVPQNAQSSYNLELGKLYRLDVGNYISDADEGIGNGQGLGNLSRLGIVWNSTEDGIYSTGRFLNVGAARTATGSFDLGPGAVHIVMVRVVDKEGNAATLPITLKVSAVPKTYTGQSGLDLLPLIILVAAVVLVVVLRLIMARGQY
jgi:hypothetical protein